MRWVFTTGIGHMTLFKSPKEAKVRSSDKKVSSFIAWLYDDTSVEPMSRLLQIKGVMTSF